MSTFAIETTGSAIDALTDALAPVDVGGDTDLRVYLTAIAGMLQEVENLSRDTDTYVGWGQMLNLPTSPSKALDWLGQFAGVRPISEQTDAQIRARIAAKEGFGRGSPGAIRAAIQAFLTGTKSVNIYERDTSPYHYTVQTYESETPVADWATTNLILNSGFEVALVPNQPAAIGDMTLTRDTTRSRSGAASGRLDLIGVANPYYFNSFYAISGATAGRVFTHTMWVYGEGAMIGTIWQVVVLEENGAFANDGNQTFFTIQPGWQKVAVTRVVFRNDRTIMASYIQWTATGPALTLGAKMWVDEMQLEEKSQATPYVETTTAPVSRPVGQGPVGKALLAQKPAGLQMTYQITLGQTWLQARTANATWTVFKATYATWDNARRAT